MNELVRHLLKTDRDGILARSKMHCHTWGVHSVVFLNAPGNTIRLFYATENHHLWTNTAEHLDSLEIGFHPHHCDLTLTPILGQFTNWTIRPFNGFGAGVLLKRFEWDSKLRDGSGSFKWSGSDFFKTYKVETIFPGDQIHLNADQLHTVSVPKGERAAWFVFEGKEDPNYQPFCYSTRQLEDHSSDSLYTPMRPAVLDSILSACKLTR